MTDLTPLHRIYTAGAADEAERLGLADLDVPAHLSTLNEAGLRAVAALAWEEGAKFGIHLYAKGEAVLPDIDNPYNQK